MLVGVCSYPITAGTLSAGPDYQVAFTGAALTVAPAALVVTAQPAAAVYGPALPALTFTDAGLVNGDTAGVFTGGLSTTAAAGADAGAYPITAGTLTAGPNYAIALHLHFPDGELIRTTPEHPFWVQGRGWTAAGALKAGDRVATRSGEWVPIAEVFDTEQWETVYNVRVADFHTYFVGEESWGWAAWAHNSYAGLLSTLQRIGGLTASAATTLRAQLWPVAGDQPEFFRLLAVAIPNLKPKTEIRFRQQRCRPTGPGLALRGFGSVKSRFVRG